MTKPDNDKTSIALINNNIGYIQKDICEIKVGIKSLDGVFASKDDLLQVTKETDIRLATLEKAGSITKYVTPIISGVLCSFITWLLVSYMQRI